MIRLSLHRSRAARGGGQAYPVHRHKVKAVTVTIDARAVSHLEVSLMMR